MNRSRPVKSVTLSLTMSSNSDISNQAEHEHISTSLEVEQLEVNLFRSKSLYMPARARGVFGGFVNQACPFSQCGYSLNTDK